MQSASRGTDSVTKGHVTGVGTILFTFDGSG